MPAKLGELRSWISDIERETRSFISGKYGELGIWIPEKYEELWT